MNAHERGTRIEDERHGLERVLDNALREAEACAGYALDAEAVGDERLAGFFREVQAAHERIAERGEDMLSGGGTGCRWWVFSRARSRSKVTRETSRRARRMRRRELLLATCGCH
ncbi:MAG TPA: hypothetical protein VJ086_07525 [Rubrobacteraceae bacterium]|nr:hypothetical protein [Rubrobacteraceae bacterium]